MWITTTELYITARFFCKFAIMDASTTKSTMHLGRKIGRMRELLGVKQETLAAELGISQQSVSKMEQSEKVDDERLEQVAKILGVETEAIRRFNEESIVNNINNTFHDSSIQNQINPVKEIIELYERLLQSEREKVAMLEKLLGEKRK